MQMESKNGKQFIDIESTKDSEKLFSFFVHKRKLSSEFDHKGAKQFLNEKQKALEEIILNDEIDLIIEKKCKKNKDVKNNAQCHHGHQGKNKNRLMPIFSLTYFQANIKAASGLELAKFNDARIGIVDKDFNFKYWSYMPDGSLVYSMKQQKATSDDVIKVSESFALKNLDDRFAKNTHASEYSKKYLDKLIKYLIDNGTQVEIFLCPLAPALWDAYDENLRPILSEAENYCHEMAAKYNLKLTGSYNPYKVGIRNSDYYDARHVRRERLSKYFDFKP